MARNVVLITDHSAAAEDRSFAGFLAVLRGDVGDVGDQDRNTMLSLAGTTWLQGGTELEVRRAAAATSPRTGSRMDVFVMPKEEVTNSSSGALSESGHRTNAGIEGAS
ncbi:hypothetical protein CLAFUW4_08526 [Fulvia fulva]|uniref:Uncharacterized protein n=1 Tax=Passalora fulva TaxID=5499 RepID=A0A9Q8P668_PASFU|nr:uncharacterized protein CLAFUR5_08628 [Fulvia fulva]KAK4629176.1 hypothetical protein CLAFUR4_08531 [Fulvia fulva]KAK4630700.1 hypothetical protein CLAFUR0_08526 [Fulvia fulva]UJO14641.1 hypothetical protein CLAFUR5_08628 [Fulvia fulva]WPV12291.1 hypothetical protein CLAFUW4_08526 [Fulvia fulva]WPV27479.1 hypothetical protein CLAFUW7_08526 [Fulvia fulva]